VKGATRARKPGAVLLEFQSTLPVKGATPPRTEQTYPQIVSIHAPGEGSDLDLGLRISEAIVSIHAPGEGSDLAIHMFHN